MKRIKRIKKIILLLIIQKLVLPLEINNRQMSEKIKIKSFPVYLPEDVYMAFNALCKAKRTPMTKIAEVEINKFIKRETPIII